MSGRQHAILALTLSMGWAGSAHAGVYSTTEPAEGVVSADYRVFAASYAALQRVDLPPSNVLKEAEPAPRPLETRYLLIKALTARGVPSDLTIEQRINLGAGLIRLRKFRDAIQVMKPGERQDPDNFLLASNLATAFHLSGDMSQATRYMDLALSAWPADWSSLGKDRKRMVLEMGWNKDMFDRYRTADQYYRKLLRLRLSRMTADDGRQPEAVDSLFAAAGGGPVRFVSEGGKYEAGKIAAAEHKKLPKDAVLIVQQLLLWTASAQPEDVRLIWLLGELYNAQGDARTAKSILGGLYKRLLFGGGVSRTRYAELVEHLSILDRQGGGQAATIPVTAAEPTATAVPPEPPTGWTPNPWQMLGVGFLGGLVVAFLGYWQVREVLRRRRPRALAPKA